MTRLRVGYLIPSLNPGGAEKQMLTLAERLPRDRFAVDFLVLSGRGTYDEQAIRAGLRVRILGDVPPPMSSLPRQLLRRAYKSMRYASAARTARYDVIDAWLYPTDVMAALLRGLTGTRVVVGGRRNLSNFHDPHGALENRVAAFANRHVDAIVANSLAVADDVKQRERVEPAKVRVIRNGVELIPQTSESERITRRRALRVADGDVLVACVANYREVKRLDLLIEAFAPVARGDPRTVLMLLGEGPQRVELETLIGGLGLDGRIRLAGTVSDPRPLYGAFDVVVQASRSEGLPNALLEASAAGRPIVATNAGGTSEIVIDGQTGLLVPINARDALTSAIHRLVSDPDLGVRLGAGAREHVAKTFGVDRFVKEFSDLYEMLSAAKGKSSKDQRPAT